MKMVIPSGVIETGNGIDRHATEPRVGKLRQALPQVLACMTKNLLLFDLGLAYGFPTIVIPVLRGFANARNPNETLHFTAIQSTWYGSIALLTELITSILSGWFTDTLGRRRTMIFVNVPHIVAWILMYRATSTTEIFIAGVLLGIGVGLMETAIITYVGEISHHSLRGILLTLSNLSGMLGMSAMYLAGSLALWRHVALMCAVVPLLALVLICFIPETPYWLLSRNRNEDAMKSLQWLRGWVPSRYVQSEYSELQQFITKSMACIPCKQAKTVCNHSTSYWRRSLEIRMPNTIRPMIVVVLSFVLSHCCGLTAIRPYLVQIVTVFRVPVDANYYTAISGGVELLANIAMILLVKHVGKRPLFLLTTGLAGCCIFGLSIIGFCMIPRDASSFDEHFVTYVATTDKDNTLAMVLFMMMTFCAAMAMGVPWMLLSELYPIRVRAAASGLSAAFNYLCMFAVTKSYLAVEKTLSIGGGFMLYFALGVVTWIIIYSILPETEGRSLVEIETHFSKPTFRLTDRTISKVIWKLDDETQQSTEF